MQVLAELDALGIELRPDGDRLRFRPQDLVTEALIARMRMCKTELLALVRQREAVADQMARQLDCLVSCRLSDGRWAWANPRYRDEIEKLGF